MDRLYKPSYLVEILDKYNFKFNKGLGQNFLIDGNVVKKIVQSADVKDATVLEIGPGVGTLTQELLETAKRVVVIEKDTRLREVLEETSLAAEKYFGDFLDLNIEEIFGDEQVHVVANLPYYITTPIIEKLLKSKLNLKSITIMVQKEVAKRMCAKKSSSDYGSLTVFLNYYTEPKYLFEVKRTVFMPRPNVDSAVVNLRIKDRLPITDEKIFFDIMHAAFIKRRKTILNALTTGGIGLDKSEVRELLSLSNIDENLRAENLSFEDYFVLSVNYDSIRRYDGEI